MPTDVADNDRVEALAQRAVDELGRIDVWVNNAAVIAYGAIGDVPVDVQRRILEVNLMGTMHGARAALPHLKEQGRGVIVNVASLYAKMTSPYVSAYATSKFGVIGFSEVLRQELNNDRGLHVCAVLPGSIDTPIFRHVGQLHHLASSGHALVPRTYSKLAPRAMRLVAIGKESCPHDDGNVFDPQPDLDAVRRGWRKRPARAAAAAGAVAAAATATFAARRRF